jgi:periplasmic protein TonB
MKGIVTAVFVAGSLGAQVLASAQQPKEVTTAPVLIKDLKAAYTPEAMRKKEQGRVGLALTVKTDGTVGKVRVTQHLSPELDAEAVKAVKQWRFKPGTKNGKPVPVDTNAEMTFALR